MVVRVLGSLALAVIFLLAGSGNGRGESTPVKGMGETRLLPGLGFDPAGGPVSIKADVLEVDYMSNHLTYRGGVVVRQNDLVLKSDELTLLYQVEEADPIVRAVAAGDVVIRKGETVAEGGRAVYERATQTVVLSEGPVLRQGPNEIGGEKIKVYLAEGRSLVEGGRGRVRAVIYPGSKGVGVE